MATAGLVGFGTTLKWNTVAIAELKGDIPFPGMSADDIDFTSHDSASQFSEWKAGMRHGGEVSIEGNFIPGDAATLAAIADFLTGTQREVIITGPAAAAFTWTFNAYVKSLGGALPQNDAIGFSLTLKITGMPVLGITASANITALVYTDSVGTKTSLPVFAAGTYFYSVTIATASTWIKLTVTQATATEIKATCLGVDHILTSTVMSEQITVGAAASTTPLTIKVKDTGKYTKTYTIDVVRP